MVFKYQDPTLQAEKTKVMSYFGFNCCGKYHDPKQYVVKRACFSLYLYKKKSGKKLRAGTKAEIKKEQDHWLGPSGLLSLLSYTAWAHLSKDGIAYSDCLSTSINNWENGSTGLTTGQLIWKLSQFSFPIHW